MRDLRPAHRPQLLRRHAEQVAALEERGARDARVPRQADDRLRRRRSCPTPTRRRCRASARARRRTRRRARPPRRRPRCRTRPPGRGPRAAAPSPACSRPAPRSRRPHAGTRRGAPASTSLHPDVGRIAAEGEEEEVAALHARGVVDGATSGVRGERWPHPSSSACSPCSRASPPRPATGRSAPC